jgi:glycosyltransferase involved in cell wall biosynthesis
MVARYPGVRYLYEPRPGLDIARNAGARAARGEIVAYTDDDVEVTPEWTRQLKESFSDPLVMAVTGLVIPCNLDTPAQYIFERYWGFNKGYLPKTFDAEWFKEHLPYGVPAWEIGAGANMAFRRDIFFLAGWFDERLDVGAAGCSGDSEMWYRVLAEGWNCLYRPQLVVYHHHRKTMKELRKQLYYYMRGHVCAALVQYEKYGHDGDRRRLFRTLPLHYLHKWIGSFRHRDPVIAGAGGTIWWEARGCVSGWWYYRSAAKRHERTDDGQNVPDADPLKRKVVVREGALVSVIIPSYNYREYLGQAIQSVLDQSYPQREIIVVDDGSTDGTDELCRQYETVRYIRVERVGLSAARNIGVRASRGEFLAFLDADDLLYPNALELNLYYFGYYPDAAFVSGAFDKIDKEGKLLEAPEPVDRVGDNYCALLRGNYIGMEATVLYRRELFFRYFFDPGLVACEDYDLNLRIARNLPVYAHSHKIAAYRMHDRNQSKNREWMARVVLGVLKNQEPYLRNEKERACYEEGLENWKQYYGYGSHSVITAAH